MAAFGSTAVICSTSGASARVKRPVPAPTSKTVVNGVTSRRSLEKKESGQWYPWLYDETHVPGDPRNQHWYAQDEHRQRPSAAPVPGGAHPNAQQLFPSRLPVATACIGSLQPRFQTTKKLSCKFLRSALQEACSYAGDSAAHIDHCPPFHLR